LSDFLQAAAAGSVLRMTPGDPVVIEAAASDASSDAPKRFSAVGYTGGALRANGFNLPTVVDLTGLVVPSQTAPVLREHDTQRPVGHSETIEVSAQRIKVTGVLSHPGDDTDKIVASASKGYPWQTSISVLVDRVEHVDHGQKVTVNGRSFVGPLVVVRASTWRELSYVTLGADSKTSAVLAAKLSEGDPMTFSEWLKAKGIDEATTPEGTLNVLRATYKAEQGKPAAEAEGGLGELRASIKHKKDVEALVLEASRKCPEKLEAFEQIGQDAIAGKWGLEKTEMKILTATVAQAAPLAFSASRTEVNSGVLEAALCSSLGLPVEKHFDERTLEAAQKRFKGRIGIHEVTGICARAHGFEDTVNGGNIHEALKACYRGELRASAGPSTYSIGGILSNTLRKTVKEAFMSVEDAWRKVFSTTSVKDFKTHTSYSLTGDLTYKRVAPGGEIKQGTLGETSYTNSADTYGMALCIDRSSLINDDAGALNSVGRRLGRGGALQINDLVWSTFKANTNFFTAWNGNYATGTTTAFSNDGLVAADILWAAMTDPDGKPMGHTARICLVPPALKIPAMRMFGSMKFTANDEEGELNPWSGRFNPVSSVYLNDSTTAWYLLCEPGDMPVLVVSFLNGREEPFIESVDMVPGKLGLYIQAYHDVGADFQEPRGGYKFKGVV
jgi:hypothetical protein